MKLPRLRFTVRRMLIAVAIVALILVAPVSKSLIWLHGAPRSYGLIRCTLNPWSDRLKKPASVGQAVPVHFPYQCEMPPSTPSWLPYKVSVGIKVIHLAPGQDFSTGTVESVHENHHTLMNGMESWSSVRGGLDFDLKPSRPGNYAIRYETHVTDVFGRGGMVECNTAGFKAQ